jgi:hypothetical protein
VLELVMRIDDPAHAADEGGDHDDE